MDSATADGEHLSAAYARYHHRVYLPEHVVEAARAFLPDPGVELPQSPHYESIQRERRLPRTIRMPGEYTLVDVTVVRETMAVFRACIRFPWRARQGWDFVAVLEGDHTLVTGYWNRQGDEHETLDEGLFEQPRKGWESWTEGHPESPNPSWPGGYGRPLEEE